MRELQRLSGLGKAGSVQELGATPTPGAALVGAGAALTVAGVLLLAWPPPRSTAQPPQKYGSR